MSSFDEDACLKYYPFDGDFGSPGDKILRDKIVTTRKPTECSECLTLTQVGERTRTIVAIFDGQLMSYRFCSHCCEAFSFAFDYSTDKFIEKLEERNAVRMKNRAIIQS